MKLYNNKGSEDIDAWEWHQASNIFFLKCRAFEEKGFRHGFFTKNPKSKHPEDLSLLLGGTNNFYKVNQVHGDCIVNTSQIKKGNSTKADCLVSGEKDQSLWIYTADCIPILFASLKTGHVAACHAGWKGIRNEIIIKTLKYLQELGSNPNSIIVAIGPCISMTNYPIGKDVARSILNNWNEKRFGLENISTQNKDSALFKETKNPNKLLFNIRNAAKLQLNGVGLNDSQISTCPICTFKEKDKFHSWRREKAKNSQWSGIISN